MASRFSIESGFGIGQIGGLFRSRQAVSERAQLQEPVSQPRFEETGKRRIINGIWLALQRESLRPPRVLYHDEPIDNSKYDFSFHCDCLNTAKDVKKVILYFYDQQVDAKIQQVHQGKDGQLVEVKIRPTSEANTAQTH